VFVEMLCVLRPGEVGLRPARWWVRPCECAVGSSYIRTVAGGGRRVNRPGGRAASDVIVVGGMDAGREEGTIQSNDNAF